jgi:hypothetical protein
MKWLLTFTLIVLFYPLAASGQGDVVLIEGLSFECRTCLQLDERNCEFQSSGAVRRLSCNSLLERLLTASVLKERTELPRTSELVEFLAFEKRSDLLARHAIRLLLRDVEGQSAILASFVRFHSGYSHILEEELRLAELPADYLIELWRQKETLSASTRAYLVARSAELQSSDFFATLSVVDIDFDIKQLRNAMSAEAQLPPEFTLEIADAVRFLFSCKHSSNCSFREVQFPAVRYYSARVQANKAVSSMTSSTSPSEILESLAEVDYREIRTPRMHELMSQALRETIDFDSLPQEQRELIAYFASHDPSLRQVLSSQVTEPRRGVDKEVPIMELSLFIGAILLTVFYLLRRVLRGQAQQRELTELMGYFELSEQASMDELSQSFRRKARELHPDTGSGDSAQFAIMNERYQRAKQLKGGK